MEKNEVTMYCEYCDTKIVEHKNYAQMILNRRENGIGVECDDCHSKRNRKLQELWDKEEFPKLVENQHRLLTESISILNEWLEEGAHFFPMEYDAYDLTGDIKQAKITIEDMKRLIEKVFPKLLNKKGETQ